MILSIQRMECNYTVSVPGSEASLLQRRLDRIAGELLGRALSRSDGESGLPDEFLVFIEQMQVAVRLDRHRVDDQKMAEVWARALQQSIHHTIQSRDSGIVIFRSRAEYLASFLTDLLHGCESQRWIYAKLEPGGNLSASQAAVQVLTHDSDVGRETLQMLSAKDLELLLSSLSDTEVSAVVQYCLLPSVPSMNLSRVTLRWITALSAWLRRGEIRLAGRPAHDLARIYLGLLRSQPDLGPDVHLARFVDGLIRLAGNLDSSTWRTLLSDLQAGDWRAAEKNAGNKHAAAIQSLRAGGDADLAVQLLQELHQVSNKSVIPTSFAGVWLLIPAALELDLFKFLDRVLFPDPENERRSAPFLLAIMAQCLGPIAAAAALHDLSLQHLAGFSRPVSREWLESFASSLTPTQLSAIASSWEAHRQTLEGQRGWLWRSAGAPPAPMPVEAFSLFSGQTPDPSAALQEFDRSLQPISVALLQRFAGMLGAFAGSSPEYLRRNFLACPGEIEIGSGQFSVHLLGCPLAIALRMAGFDNATWELPSLGKHTLEYQFD
jgi:hypothetical protein